MANRITGKYGVVQIIAAESSPSGSGKTDIFNWEANFTQTVLDASIKGEAVSGFVSSHATGTFTAERYIQTKATLSGLLASTYLTGARVTFALYMVNTSSTYSVITGAGYVTRADVSAPHAKAVDRIEVQMDEFVITAL